LTKCASSCVSACVTGALSAGPFLLTPLVWLSDLSTRALKQCCVAQVGGGDRRGCLRAPKDAPGWTLTVGEAGTRRTTNSGKYLINRSDSLLWEMAWETPLGNGVGTTVGNGVETTGETPLGNGMGNDRGNYLGKRPLGNDRGKSHQFPNGKGLGKLGFPTRFPRVVTHGAAGKRGGFPLGKPLGKLGGRSAVLFNTRLALSAPAAVVWG
jgi:hypothetical protein